MVALGTTGFALGTLDQGSPLEAGEQSKRFGQHTISVDGVILLRVNAVGSRKAAG